MDLLFILITAVFFAATIALVYAFEKLHGR